MYIPLGGGTIGGGLFDGGGAYWGFTIGQWSFWAPLDRLVDVGRRGGPGNVCASRGLRTSDCTLCDQLENAVQVDDSGY